VLSTGRSRSRRAVFPSRSRRGWRCVGLRLRVSVLQVAGCVGIVLLGSCGPSTPAQTTGAPSATTEAAPVDSGDIGPHHAENTRWRQRRDLGEPARRDAEADAARVREVLESVRRQGSFDEESVSAALQALGHRPDAVDVRAFVPSALAEPSSPPPVGVVYGVRVGPGACVFGDIRPERVSVETGGTIPEFGCAEPPNPH
jgi:hypothetical protein